jgi:hypothetical protein
MEHLRVFGSFDVAVFFERPAEGVDEVAHIRPQVILSLREQIRLAMRGFRFVTIPEVVRQKTPGDIVGLMRHSEKPALDSDANIRRLCMEGAKPFEIPRVWLCAPEMTRLRLPLTQRKSASRVGEDSV